MRTTIFILGRRAVALLALALLGGLLGATLVRYAPGYGVDERELDPRLSAASVEALRGVHRHEAGLLSFYGNYLWRAARGDFGVSESMQQPIFGLVKERLPVTARSVVLGLFVAWSAALILSVASLSSRGWVISAPSTLVSGFLLALPAAVVALFSVYLRAPVFLAIAAVTFPKLFRYTRNLLVDASAQPHVLAARARGVGRVAIFLRHIFPTAVPGLVALLGVSVSLAFGVSVPIEALCDSAGIGQLAWNAALNRDMPLIIALTLVVTVMTVAFNSLAADASTLFKRTA
jgi:peptide/nickel transport system permease protein